MSHRLAGAVGSGASGEDTAICALVADPARCRMLLALDDCRALPACGLAAGRDLLSEPFALPPPGAHPAEAC